MPLGFAHMGAAYAAIICYNVLKHKMSIGNCHNIKSTCNGSLAFYWIKLGIKLKVNEPK